MTVAEIIEALLIMLAGLGIFLFGLKVMSEMLEVGASNRLRLLLNNVTKNRFMGLGVGAGVTAIIQSSSATTVMVVGLVNSGIIDLYQATAVIMGANIGTTVTGLIIALKALPITPILAAATAAGVLTLMFSKNSKVKTVSQIVIGIGMIFTGLIVMSGAMNAFAALPEIKSFFSSTTNPFLLMIIGALVTALIQSSSAATGIVITMGSAGLVDIYSSMFVILGINIGTCVTALFASLGTGVNARRAAAIHLTFNISGALIFLVLLLIPPIRNFFGYFLPPPIESKIAVFHLIFNIVTTAALLPFIKLLVFISVKLVRGKEKAGKDGLYLMYLNDLILETPAIAVAQAKKEILRMAALASQNLALSIKMITEKNLEGIEEFDSREKLINYLNRNITAYLVKISALSISHYDELVIGSYYHVVSDIERVGDYAENITDFVKELIKEGCEFSDEAKNEILEMYNEILRLSKMVIEAFTGADLSAHKEILEIEDAVDGYKKSLSDRHVKRLNEGICTPASGAQYLHLIDNLERICDHYVNVVNSVKDYARAR